MEKEVSTGVEIQHEDQLALVLHRAVATGRKDGLFTRAKNAQLRCHALHLDLGGELCFSHDLEREHAAAGNVSREEDGGGASGTEPAENLELRERPGISHRLNRLGGELRGDVDDRVRATAAAALMKGWRDNWMRR